MFWEVGVIKLTANRRQFSPISLKRGRKQAKLPDPLWDEGHYRIGFRRPSQDMENQALSSCLRKTNSTAKLKRKPIKRDGLKLLIRFDLSGLPVC